MIEHHSLRAGVERAPGLPMEAPLGSVAVSEMLHPWVDRKLGYLGDARFVMFYYEPRGDEVIWRDDRSYGFGAGAWCFFTDKIAPLAERYHVNLGNSISQGEEALLIDRVKRQAYFAKRKHTEQFIARQQSAIPHAQKPCC